MIRLFDIELMMTRLVHLHTVRVLVGSVLSIELRTTKNIKHYTMLTESWFVF
jgi:hypothetical protein